MDIIIKSSAEEISKQFAVEFKKWVEETVASGRDFHVALSGGSTPKVLFKHWASEYKDSLPWNKIHFYWGDERCVPKDDAESNYGMTKELLFDHVPVDESKVHRVIGENEPSDEAIRYGEEMSEAMPVVEDYPQLDLNILGMGGDGHTASIFPYQMELLKDMNVCAVAKHPESGQRRVTMTGPVLNNAKKVAFLVTGAGKAEIFAKIRDKKENYLDYPAAHITAKESLQWYVDEVCAR